MLQADYNSSPNSSNIIHRDICTYVSSYKDVEVLMLCLMKLDKDGINKFIGKDMKHEIQYSGSNN